MTDVFIVVVNDKHTDIEVEAFDTEERAMKYARDEVLRLDLDPYQPYDEETDVGLDELDEDVSGSTIWFYSYGESHLFVEKKEMNAP